MSRGQVSVRAVLLTLLGVVFVAGLVGWWLATHKREAFILHLPRTGEARRNPLFALQVALQKNDVPVQSRQRLQLLPGNAREPAVPLQPRDTLVLFNDPRTLSEAELDRLLPWIAQGGHLIVRTPPGGRLARNTVVPLLTALELAPLDKESECEDVLAPARPDPDGERADGDDANTGADGGTPDARDWDLLFCGGRRFTLDGANPRYSWGDLKAGYVFARVDYGRGSVDVLADLDFLDTDHLAAPADHALAWQLLQPNLGAGTVHLVYATQMPSLWRILIRHSWMAWGPLLLALLFWLWRRMQRFGPQLAAPAGERRSLLEHIVASGELTYRYGYAHLLYDAVRSAFLARLRRRDPQAAALEGEPQLALLAERFPDVPRGEIRDALMPPFGNDHAAFRTRIATLIRLRNRL